MATATGYELSSRVHFDGKTAAVEANGSGVSWAAVAGGAIVAASMSLALLSLGAGLGLSSVSPWSNVGASANSVSAVSVLWLIITQIVSASLGGYLAGRLRTRWVTVHSDEVHFRDTAHGLLVWSVGLVVTAAFLTSAAASMVGSATTTETASPEPQAYYVDSLFRTDRQAAFDGAAHLEAGRILTMALSKKEMASADRAYLVQLVANRTGLSPADSDKRISDVLSQARLALDTARKAVSDLLLWLFVALLTGAFCASYAATIGGNQRDRVKTV